MGKIIGIASDFFADLILQGFQILTSFGAWPYILCGFAMVCVTRFILLPLYGGQSIDFGPEKKETSK